MWLRGRWGQIKFPLKEEEFPSHPITTHKYKQMSRKNLGISHDFPWITVNHVNPGPIHTQIADRVGTKELSPFVGHRPIAINRVHYVGAYIVLGKFKRPQKNKVIAHDDFLAEII